MPVDPEAEIARRPPPDERTSEAVIAVELFLSPTGDPEIVELHARTEWDGELWTARLHGTDVAADGYVDRRGALLGALGEYLVRTDARVALRP